MHHSKKPEKFRDKSGGKVLNKRFLSGPGLTNKLIAILMRFIEEEIVITSDRETMFYQVRIPPEERSFGEFL